MQEQRGADGCAPPLRAQSTGQLLQPLPLCSSPERSAEKYWSKSLSDTDLLISFCQLTVWLLYHGADATPSCESAQREKKSSWPQQMIDIYLSACQGAAISSRQK